MSGKKELTNREIWEAFWIFRGLEHDEICPECDGAGQKAYSSTATYHGSVGGQTITGGICDKCWGSGSWVRPWQDPRVPRLKEQDIEAIERKAWNAALDKASNFAHNCTFGWDIESWKNMTKDELISDTCHKIGEEIKDMKK